MVNSMTGYGAAEAQFEGATYTVEIRTVNGRYFKSRIKLPDAAAFLEEDIEKFLRRNISRGAVNYVLRLKNVSADVLFDINETALRAYVERLGRVASSVRVECPIDIGSMLLLPGILLPAVPDEEKAKQIREVVLRVSGDAIEQLKRMRAAEGAALVADLDGHCEAIKQDIERIRNHSAAILQNYAKRLKKRVDELLSDAKLELDEATVAREAAIFAERSDISEELARLDSHIQQFAESCKANDQAGRRLDFIGQEMLREANTIASKASDTEIIHRVVDIKCRIDRIKEQVQNIE